MKNYHLNIKTNKYLSSELRKAGNALKQAPKGNDINSQKAATGVWVTGLWF